MTNDITMLQNAVMMSLRILVRGPALIIISAVFAVRINPGMSAILLVMLPIIVVIVALIMKFGFPMFQKMQKKLIMLTALCRKILSACALLRRLCARITKG